jgi:predicted AAA+ superfamily ATPase
MFRNIIIIALGAVIAIGIAYDVLWGRDKRLFRSRSYCYKNLKVPPMSDEEFGNYQHFVDKRIPGEYAIQKRHLLADEYLDYPWECLHPDMTWDDIPLDSSPWERDIDGLHDYIRQYNADPRDFLSKKTVAEIIVCFYLYEHLEFR